MPAPLETELNNDLIARLRTHAALMLAPEVAPKVRELLNDAALAMNDAADELAGRPEVEQRDWLIWSNEHGAWWGPDRCGYPFHWEQAGLYTLTEARSICKSRAWLEGEMPPEVMIHIDEVRYALRVPQKDSQ